MTAKMCIVCSMDIISGSAILALRYLLSQQISGSEDIAVKEHCRTQSLHSIKLSFTKTKEFKFCASRETMTAKNEIVRFPDSEKLRFSKSPMTCQKHARPLAPAPTEPMEIQARICGFRTPVSSSLCPTTSSSEHIDSPHGIGPFSITR